MFLLSGGVHVCLPRSVALNFRVMPSKKSSTQGKKPNKSAQAQLVCRNAFDALLEEDASPLATTDAAEVQQIVRSPSHKSLSTDEGSISSGCSSSPISSEEMTKSPESSEEITKSPESHQEAISPGASMRRDCRHSPEVALVRYVCVPDAPLWVDNGAKDDKAKWLLVQPKFSTDGLVSDDISRSLKSSKNVALLGRCVSTKNTFLEESDVDCYGKPILEHSRRRARSR